jgi:hypothetical protein
MYRSAALLHEVRPTPAFHRTRKRHRGFGDETELRRMLQVLVGTNLLAAAKWHARAFGAPRGPEIRGA